MTNDKFFVDLFLSSFVEDNRKK